MTYLSGTRRLIRNEHILSRNLPTQQVSHFEAILAATTAMSRPPPSYISKDDVYALNAVRKDIWANGLYGLGLGSLAGLVLHSVASLASKRGGLTHIKTNRNTAFMSVMLGGAIGSFVLSTTAGKNDVHQLHGIFESGSREARQERLQHGDLSIQPLPEEVERMQREKNRLIRRESLERSLKSPHGLSDSHGGHWAEDDKKA